MTNALPSIARVPAAETGVTLADFLVPIRLAERVSPALRSVLLVAAGALLIELTALVAIPLPGNPVPLTLQTLGVLVAGGALGLRRGAISAAVYVVLGVVGLPVFAEGRAGLAVIWGATGGYLLGFVVAAALVGRLAELGWDRRPGAALVAALLGSLVIHLLGVPWLAFVTGMGPAEAVATGLVPFLPGDLLKVAAAAVLMPAGWWVVGRRPSDR